jgi:thioredoxin 1
MACDVISTRDFRRLVLETREPALVAFTAKFCEASQELLPVMDKVSDRFDGRGVFAIDFGEDETRARASGLAARYGVKRLPAIIAFSDGRPKDLIGGLTTAEDVIDMFERQLRPVREVIGARNFEVEVLESRVPVLVHFHAGSCAASESLIPVIDETAKSFRGRAKVVRVEANPFNAGVMERYGAIRTPMVAAFEDGEMKDAIMGTVVDSRRLGTRDGTREAVDHVGEMLAEYC